MLVHRTIFFSTSLPAAAISAVALLAGCGGRAATQHQAGPAGTKQPTAAAKQASPSPSYRAHPNPQANWTGSCSDNPGTPTSHFLGEVDLTNTGNIGIVVKAKIGWPQEGYAPVIATGTTRVLYGGTGVIRFHIPVSFNTDFIYSTWIVDHNSKAGSGGCLYRIRIIRDYGSVH
jgi:hypothetical protein